MVKEVLDVSKELSEEGLTMLIVTQRNEFRKRVADKVIFMDGGSSIRRRNSIGNIR